MPVELPYWMWERIVAILSEHPYTGCEDIIREITEQMQELRKAPSERVVPYQGGIHMMTPRQKQGIMGITSDANGKYYYEGPLDGIWGPKSKEAAERFLRDFAGEETATDNNVGSKSVWDGIKHFTHAECRCRCGGKYCDRTKEPERALLEVADEIREEIDAPLIPTSVIRCEKWNALQPGAATNSRHKLGKAMDAWAPGMTAAELLAIAKKNPRVRYAYAVDEKVVHFDVE